MSNQSREPRSRIVDYILLTLALPVIVWMELNEMSEDISLALTGGKYSGRGRLNRKKYRDEEDEPPSDWIRPPDFDPKKFQSAIWRAKRLKLIEKRPGAHGLPELVLTVAGQAKILKRYPLLKLARRPWEGYWLVVTFDIPEAETIIRKSVRRQLLSLGFAQWQKSVYVCPHDIADDLAQVLKANCLEDKVVPMIAKRILAGDDWKFARRIFHIDEIEKEYYRLADSLKPPPKPTLQHRNFLRRQFSRFIEILKRDPFLPVGLAPKDGYGREQALKTLKAYAASVKLLH